MGMDCSWPSAYRNKAVIAVGKSKEGIPIVGFRGPKSHRIIDCDNCMIQAPTANVAAKVLRDYLTEYDVPIIQMTVKTSFGTGEVMVILYAKSKGELPGIEDFCYDLDDGIASIVGGEGTATYSLESVVLEREYTVKEGGKKSPVKTSTKKTLEFIAGKRTIKDTLMGLDFEISPRAFYQVNPVQTEKLYSKVLSYLSDDAKNSGAILDLYCGVGTIGTLVAKNFAGQVIGIESVKEAVIDANRNAVINGVVNERFICGKAEDVMPKLTNGNVEDFDESIRDVVQAVILDPPRSGCDESLLDAVVETSPARIVYVSCNPGTLARDIIRLSEGGYEFVEATPVDMFCHSSHVETVVLLCRTEC